MPAPKLFIAIRCADAALKKRSTLEVLTPLLMVWDEQTLLMDLSPCLGFWLRRTKFQTPTNSKFQTPTNSTNSKFQTPTNLPSQQVGVWNLWEQILQCSFGKKLQAVAARHPWQALTLLQQVRQRRLLGLHDAESPFGRRLSKQLSWQAWFAPSASLIQHLKAAGYKNIQAARFRSQCAQMQRAMERLGVANPAALSQARSPAIKRRFGAILAWMWEWSFAIPDTHIISDTHQCSFPWISFVPEEPPSVQRCLDFMVHQWTDIESLLIADLDALCTVAQLDTSHRVSCLAWSLIFDSLDEAHLEVRFKNPHQLSAERGHHSTALYQARYQFESLTAAIFARQRELNHRENLSVVSWRLIVSEKISLPPLARELFVAEEEIADTHYSQVCALENKLPLALHHYQLRPSFIPQEDFVSVAESSAADFELESWRLAGLHRPLFILKTPTMVHAEAERLRFIERTSSKWWEGATNKDRSLDYFIAINSQQQVRWVCRTQRGQWFCHGIFD